MTFPKELIVEEYFKCPIWWADQPKFVNKLNKASDSYIKASQKNSLIHNILTLLMEEVVVA